MNIRARFLVHFECRCIMLKYVCVCVCVCLHVYIQREKGGTRERERSRDRGRDRFFLLISVCLLKNRVPLQKRPRLTKSLRGL